MTIVLGIESTAHTFGVGIVKNKKVLANVKKTYTTEKGGIIPMEAAKHHCENKNEIYFEALSAANIKESEIDAVAFSQGPGLAPCLLEGMKFAKELVKKLSSQSAPPSESPPKKNIPLIPLNHCVAHLEIGDIVDSKDAVMLYASGANTQIIAYESGKYRIFGETLDIGVGNFIDTFARYAGIGFPGGPKIEKLASLSKNYIELPYRVKGMDIALSGILTNLKQKSEKIDSLRSQINGSGQTVSSSSQKKLVKRKNSKREDLVINNYKKSRADASNVNYNLSDLAYSMQETVFAMLVEIAERALAHTGKTELLLGGGVACNSRLQEMCRIMCKERGVKFFCPERSLLVDNGAMIAYLGEVMFKDGIKVEDCDIKPRQRTDDITVSWK